MKQRIPHGQHVSFEKRIGALRPTLEMPNGRRHVRGAVAEEEIAARGKVCVEDDFLGNPLSRVAAIVNTRRRRRASAG